MLRSILVAVVLAAGAVPAAAAEPPLESARLSADELKQLDVLLDHACRHAGEPGTTCSRAAIALLDKIGRLNGAAGGPGKEPPVP